MNDSFKKTDRNNTWSGNWIIGTCVNIVGINKMTVNESTRIVKLSPVLHSKQNLSISPHWTPESFPSLRQNKFRSKQPKNQREAASRNQSRAHTSCGSTQAISKPIIPQPLPIFTGRLIRQAETPADPDQLILVSSWSAALVRQKSRSLWIYGHCYARCVAQMPFGILHEGQMQKTRQQVGFDSHCVYLIPSGVFIG